MPLDISQEELNIKLYGLFPKLQQKQFQIFKLSRQRILVPLPENHPRALCPNGSKTRYGGTVFVKEKTETEQVCGLSCSTYYG
ncbi:hypothetical protein HOLleu_03373 [Holothuria leucospilota]|uniref:Uncharacterized protein n=1 Tax=Holothuria leucospilota TaxID=206669 RepID=A0A9Q1CRI8_HOLLE|nr:hypothetical protein HOLleu_03373 [Holothuria leucospilota]